MPTLRKTAVVHTGRPGRRAVPVALAALAIAALGGGVANAKTYTVTYDFENPRVGNAAWQPDNDPPGDTDAGPWYGSTFAPGTGLRIAPTGNAGAAYGNTRGSWWFYAPPGSTIKRARVEGLNGRANERQIARAWLANLAPDDPAPRPANVSREIRETAGSPTTWNNASFTLAPRAGQTAGGFGLWLYTSPCGGLDGAMCAPVDPTRGAFVSLRKLTTTIDDPSKAGVNVAGLGDGTVWTNSRDVDLRVEATDPQSGIASIKADVRSADGERQIGLGQWEPDTLHATPRAFATPPLGASRTAGRHITAAARGRTRFVIRTVNGAGASTVARGAIAVDRERPVVRWPRAIRPGAQIVVADADSGIAAASVKVDGRSMGEGCQRGARCTLRLPQTLPSRAAVEVTATDAAGNYSVRTRRAAASTGSTDAAPVENRGPSVLAGSLELDVSSVPAGQDVWYSVYARPDNPDDPTLGLDGGLPVAGGTVKGGAVRTIRPTTRDAAAVDYVARRSGVLNVSVIVRTAGRLTARPAVWYLQAPAGAAATARGNRANRLKGNVRASARASTPGDAPRSRPLPGAPRIGREVVPKTWLKPRITADFDTLAATSGPPPEDGTSEELPEFGEFRRVEPPSDPTGPSDQLALTRSALLRNPSFGHIVDSSWKAIARDDFIDDYGDEAAPDQAKQLNGSCSLSAKTGKGLWVNRNTPTIWHDLKGIQTARGTKATIGLRLGKTVGGSGAISIGGKSKAFGVGGTVTIGVGRDFQTGVDQTYSSDKRRVVQVPIVYKRYLWRIGCGTLNEKGRWSQNYEYNEVVPIRAGNDIRTAPRNLTFLTCGKRPLGPAVVREGPNKGITRDTSASKTRDLSTEVDLFGGILKLGVALKTSSTSTVSERIDLVSNRKFKLCTWATEKPAEDGTEAVFADNGASLFVNR